jgi:phage tail sheath protein FI
MYNYISSVQPINVPIGENGINAAIYYPRIQIADPLNSGKATTKSPCGMVAGVYASTDSSRGVWKAPAGTDAALAGAIALERLLTDGENGVLNPVHVNCLRAFPGYGAVVWGARTLAAPDDSDNRYIPVRRLTLYIEMSIHNVSTPTKTLNSASSGTANTLPVSVRSACSNVRLKS